MKLGKYPISRGDSKYCKSLKRKLKKIEFSIASCSQYGFSIKKLVDARAWYIDKIKLTQK